MLDFLEKLFSSEFMPHGHCYLWLPEILWLHVISDALITLSYYSIPFALIYLVKKRKDLVMGKVFLLFSGFILLCGATHMLGIWSVWHGTYRLTGVVKMITALFSLATAIVLWPTVAKMIKLPTTQELQTINQLLQDEIDERKQIEKELNQHRTNLESVVYERTRELEEINKRLRKEIAIRESAEQKIRRSEEKYFELFEQYHDLYEYAPDMYISVSTETRKVVGCNQTMADELGMEKSEIIGRPILEMYCEDCHDTVKEVIAQFEETGNIRNVELCVARKDGSRIDVMLNATGIRDKNGKLLASRSSWRDVTAVKLANRAVEDSVARMSAILESAVDAIITIDRHGIVESFNHAAERMFGFRADEMVGRNVQLLMPAPYRKGHDDYLQNYLITREKKVIGIRREVEGRRRNGRVFPIDLSVSEFEVDGEIRFTAIIRDISERKRLQRVKDDFVSIVSHELRTPITSINGSLGAIAAGTVGELPEVASKMVDIARRNCERLIRLINDLLDIQKMEAGKFEIHPEPVNMIRLLENAVEVNQGFASEHNVTLELLHDDDECMVMGDPDRLVQVITNLVSNAAKFSPPDEVVTLKAEIRHDAVRVEITDRGKGIPEEARKQIFQKFVQAESAIRRSKGGTGLGLSISRRIVELHHGEIGFESETGKGTTFFFELPCLVPVESA